MRANEQDENALLRRFDARFLLPDLPRTATLLGSFGVGQRVLKAAGVDVVGPEAGGDVVFADPQTAPGHATARDAVILGRARVGSPLLALPDLLSTRAYLTPRHGRAAGYGLGRWTVARTRKGRLRQRLAVTAVRHGVVPPGYPVMEIRTARTGEPAVVHACVEAGLAPAAWFFAAEAGPVARRCAFFLFAPAATTPSAVAKFQRLPGVDQAHRREEAGLAVAGRSVPTVRDHAPRLLGCLDVDDHHVCVQTAVAGTNLEQALTSRPGQLGAALVESVAQWLLDVATQTAGSATAAREERAALRSELTPYGVDAELGVLDRVPTVLQHGDLAGGNVLVTPDGFGVIDWEWATPTGVPLWDLLHFGLHALPLLDGASTDADYFRRLFLGAAPSSPRLFEWVRQLATALAIEPDDVADLATLCWAHHRAVTERVRAEPLIGEPVGPLPVETVFSLWRTEPGLGRGWATWR